MDHYCILAAASAPGSDDMGSSGGGGGFRLVLCPCALQAVHHGTPVDCSCGSQPNATGQTSQIHQSDAEEN